MIEHKRKILWAAVSTVVAVLAVILWNPADGSKVEVDSSESPSTVDAGTVKPLMFRTTFGEFDLTKGATPANTVIPGVPESLVNIPASPDADNNVRVLVQFNQPVKRSHRESLKEAGAEIMGYYPDNILSVKVAEDRVASIKKQQNVHTVVERPTWVSLQPNLFGMMAKMVEARQKGGLDDQIALLIDGDSGSVTLKQQLLKAGIEVNRERSDFARVRGTLEELQAAIPTIMAVPSVTSIQLYIPNTASDSPESVGVSPAIPPTLYNVNSGGIVQSGNLGETTIWDRGLTGAGQFIVVCDSGTDPDHMMFNDPTLPPDVTPPLDLTALPADSSRRKIVLYINAHGGPTNYDDVMGHGTHVAGSMCGQYLEETVLADLYDHMGIVDTNVSGYSNNGMAPEAKLVVSDIGAADGSLDFASVADIWGAGPALNANIVNNSWGRSVFFFGIRFGFTSYDAQVKNYDEFGYANPNFLIMRAAGNDGDLDDTKTIGLEAEAKNELCVGALGNGSYDGTGADQKAYFSSEGPTSDGRFRPHIMAPGHQVISAYGDGVTTGANKDLALMSGTSMATPTACGAITLIRQYFTDGHYPNSLTPSSALLKAMAINSGTDLNSLSATVKGPIPNSTQGWGRITLERVLAFEDEVRQTQVWDNAGPLTTSETTTYKVTVLDNTEELRFTLAWTDPAGSVNANPTIVNDLDLLVTSPTGVKFYGNNFAEGQSIEGEYFDRINTEECVYIKEPQLGIYNVTVTAFRTPGNSVEESDSQKFALVVTGGIPRPVSSGASGDQSAGSGGCNLAHSGGSLYALLPLMMVLAVVVLRRRRTV